MPPSWSAMHLSNRARSCCYGARRRGTPLTKYSVSVLLTVDDLGHKWKKKYNIFRRCLMFMSTCLIVLNITDNNFLVLWFCKYFSCSLKFREKSHAERSGFKVCFFRTINFKKSSRINGSEPIRTSFGYDYTDNGVGIISPRNQIFLWMWMR